MSMHLSVLLILSQSINTIIGNGKRFMAYEMISRLTTANELHLLNRLSAAVQQKRKENNKK